MNVLKYNQHLSSINFPLYLASFHFHLVVKSATSTLLFRHRNGLDHYTIFIKS